MPGMRKSALKSRVVRIEGGEVLTAVDVHYLGMAIRRATDAARAGACAEAFGIRYRQHMIITIIVVGHTHTSLKHRCSPLVICSKAPRRYVTRDEGNLRYPPMGLKESLLLFRLDESLANHVSASGVT